MKNSTYKTISEFAKISGIKRDNLIFYDKIGLISPELRGENGYRYYTQRQMATAVLVSSLREIGIGTETIKAYTDQRTPLKMIALFEAQEQKIDAEIQKLGELKNMMKLYIDTTQAALEADTSAICIQERQQEPVFLGPPTVEGTPYTDESLEAFYDYATEHQVPLSYPLGVIFSKENLKKRTLESPMGFYFKVPQAQNQFKPAGRYVVGFLQGGYSQSDQLYQQMLDYIEAHDLVICGNAYEEYPLSEISVRDENDYLIKVEIMVE